MCTLTQAAECNAGHNRTRSPLQQQAGHSLPVPPQPWTNALHQALPYATNRRIAACQRACTVWHAPVPTWRLKHEGHHIRRLVCLHCDDIVVARTLEHLVHVVQVQACRAKVAGGGLGEDWARAVATTPQQVGGHARHASRSGMLATPRSHTNCRFEWYHASAAASSKLPPTGKWPATHPWRRCGRSGSAQSRRSAAAAPPATHGCCPWPAG